MRAVAVMSPSDLITGMFRAIDDARWEALTDFLDDDVIYERPGYPRLVGSDRVRHFYEVERMIASGTHTIEHIVIAGHHGACWGELVGLSKTGSEIAERFADVYEFANGKIKTRRSHFFRPAV